jgi:hypothetical protein
MQGDDTDALERVKLGTNSLLAHRALSPDLGADPWSVIDRKKSRHLADESVAEDVGDSILVSLRCRLISRGPPLVLAMSRTTSSSTVSSRARNVMHGSHRRLVDSKRPDWNLNAARGALTRVAQMHFAIVVSHDPPATTLAEFVTKT